MTSKTARLASIVLTCLFVALLTAGCSSKEQNPLIGKWASEDGSGTFEFFEDGKVVMAGADWGFQITGSFSIEDEKTLKLEFQDSTGKSGAMLLGYSFSGDKLILTIDGENRSFTKANQ